MSITFTFCFVLFVVFVVVVVAVGFFLVNLTLTGVVRPGNQVMYHCQCLRVTGPVLCF